MSLNATATMPIATPLNIVADENIPGLEQWFGDLGTIVRVPGRSLSPAQLADADILLVRSVTQVNEALLANTPVRFVGSCTIGTDHLDTHWLEQQGIAWSAAPGCNANSVVEYVFCALAALDIDWRGRNFGIVGCGNVGGSLQRKLHALDIQCKIYDPWKTDNPDSATLEEVLQQDVICLHAPLVKDGPHPSLHMLDGEALDRIRPGAVLISAGRGAVIDNRALRERDTSFTTVLDVWENEPDMDPELLKRVNLGSPHIAGYSHDGKLAGTRMIREALNQALDLPAAAIAQETSLASSPEQSRLTTDKSGFAAMRELLLSMYDPRQDDTRLRAAAQSAASGGESLPLAFDQLRKQYPKRLEFSHYTLPSSAQLPNLDQAVRAQLAILGLK
ncbi:4-phosphoerythronate dehydrogenase [Microbulbifer agarilyticus]|uniref:4-phosphoerythronate dehydrogenase n=1 Tax=Microbulbifer agarilyticus TaxID=260552 RepID=UPI001CD5429B|nr:4-phosphoerythronate dehydrogenase [Microbulbifer agarilyticus]MCA0893873.1 4-phosphoerythronate dehydrogenase [Microbulbifer agarilyticus]